MTPKINKHIFKGMHKDISDDKSSNEYYFDALNIRIDTTENGSLLAVTGIATDKRLENRGSTIHGHIVGDAVIGDTLVLFTKDDSSCYIYRVDDITEDSYTPVLVYVDNSNTLVHKYVKDYVVNYENNEVRKVYWTDGYSQPKVVNVMGDYTGRTNDVFDFVRPISNSCVCNIDKIHGMGSMTAGTIQYLFTYFDMHGQESKVFYQTQLLYISDPSGGNEPNTSVSNAFNINLYDIDTSWEYVRVYALQRSSTDTTPLARIVTEIKIADALTVAVASGVSRFSTMCDSAPISNMSNMSIEFYVEGVCHKAESNSAMSYTYIDERLVITGSNIDVSKQGSSVSVIDTGTGSESIDPSILYYIGGTDITVQTMSHKDDVMFLGNISLNVKRVSDSVKTMIRGTDINEGVSKLSYIKNLQRGEYYYDNNSMDLANDESPMMKQSISTFKKGETYRFGLQFADKYGQWSQPVFIDDKEIVTNPNVYNYYKTASRPFVTLNHNIVDAIISDGWVKVRPLVVFPNKSERSVVCQGIVCPTVFNVADRANNTPFAQASWFFRPNAEDEYYTPSENGYNSAINASTEDDKLLGMSLPFRHLSEIKGGNSYRSEIQFGHGDAIANNYNALTGYNGELSAYTSLNAESFVNNDNNSCRYFVDQNIVTLNSPDIDYDDGILGEDLNGLKFRIVGVAVMSSVMGDIDIHTTSSSHYDKGGFYRKPLRMNTDDDIRASRNILGSGMYWFDTSRSNVNRTDADFAVYHDDYDNLRGWAVYPFQKSGSLSNAVDDGIIGTKVISNLRFSSYTRYFDAYDIPVKSSSLFDSVSKIVSDLGNKKYFGNSDRILSPIGQWRYFCSFGGYKSENSIVITDNQIGDVLNNTRDEMFANPNHAKRIRKDSNGRYETEFYSKKMYSSPSVVESIQGSATVGCSALSWIKYSGSVNTVWSEHGVFSGMVIPITYKSSRHAVVEFDANTILPTIDGINGQMSGNGTNHVFWDDMITGYAQGNVNVFGSGQKYGTLFIGELYRDVDQSSRFGGTSEYALANNVWNVAGIQSVLEAGKGININFTEGDTYFQRYDCLKTMPLHSDDINQIVEIASVMIESRFNLNGRYDKNKGLDSNIYVDDTNFGLINKAYTQKDNFVQYNILDERFNSQSFPTQVTWTLPKVLGAKTDNWTSVSMVNVMNLDGDKGYVTALCRYNNNLIALQPNGVSQILFNENVAIESTKGLPIELANSGKVGGKRYISEYVGTCGTMFGACKAVIETPSGVYFYDKNNNSVYMFGSDGLKPITDNNLMKSAFDSSHDISLVYDKLNHDIVILDSKASCARYLVYNELLGEFVSYMDKPEDIIHTVGNVSIGSMSNVIGTHKTTELVSNYNGDSYRDMYIEFVESDTPEADKVFTNLEFRSDCYIGGSISVVDTFDFVESSNEYQSIESSMNNNTGSNVDFIGINNVARKFRVWRVQIGRANYGSGITNERLIGTWAKFKLSSMGGKKIRLYDAVTKFYVH